MKKRILTNNSGAGKMENILESKILNTKPLQKTNRSQRLAIFFVLLVFTLFPVNATELAVSVKAGKIAVKPNSEQSFIITATNSAKELFEGELRTRIEHGAADVIPLETKALKIPAGGNQEISVGWKPAQELWGCSVVADVMAKNQLVATGSDIFVVTDNLRKASPNWGGTHSTGGNTVEGIRKLANELADNGISIMEVYAWMPSCWGKILPDEEKWRTSKGQGPFPESKATLRALIEAAHARGIEVYSYAQSTFRGPVGFKYLKEHPEEGLYSKPDGKLEAADEERFMMSVNPQCPGALERGMDEYLKAINEIGFDGLRWDGQPGLFYNPFGDWISFCNKGRALYPYDYKGKPVISANPDSENAGIVRRMRDYVRGKKEGVLWAFNVDFGYKWHAMNRSNPLLYRELANDKMILQEEHFASNQEGRPFMSMNQTWSAMREDLLLSGDLARALCGYYYRGGFANAKSPVFVKTAAALFYASTARTYGLTPQWKNMVPYPKEFIQFALRYDKFLFHPSLCRIDNMKYPIPRLTVSSSTPFPLNYDGHCYDLYADGKYYTIIHLLNPPVTDQVNTLNMMEPPWMATDVTININQSPVLDRNRARYYVFSPEWEGFRRELKAAGNERTAILKIPEFRYWAMLVCENTLGSEKGESSTDKNLFLPGVPQ